MNGDYTIPLFFYESLLADVIPQVKQVGIVLAVSAVKSEEESCLHLQLSYKFLWRLRNVPLTKILFRYRMAQKKASARCRCDSKVIEQFSFNVKHR